MIRRIYLPFISVLTLSLLLVVVTLIFIGEDSARAQDNDLPPTDGVAVLDYLLETNPYTEWGTWPADEWTLETGDDLMFLEYEYDDGDVFLLSEPAEITDVTADGEPFRAVVRDQEPPSTVTYDGTEYVIAEEGPATRTVGDRTNSLHYWVYEGDDGFVALERYGSSDWSVYAGREVEPFEFDNILPRASS